MTWEEDPLVERLRHLFGPRRTSRPDSDERRRRSNRMRYFLTAFGSQHWAERVEGRRIPARRGHIAL
jgi:hypothetical protein